MRTQIWIAISVYVLVAIIKKKRRLNVSLHTLLQILSLTLFEKLALKQSVAGVEPIETNPAFYRQLNLFELPAQAVDATQALNRSAGVSKPKVLRGRSLSWRATWLRRSCVDTDKLVPFGKLCLFIASKCSRSQSFGNIFGNKLRVSLSDDLDGAWGPNGLTLRSTL